MSKLNIVLLVALVTLSTARAFAHEEDVVFEPNTMTEQQLDAELEELLDIQAIEGVNLEGVK